MSADDLNRLFENTRAIKDGPGRLECVLLLDEPKQVRVDNVRVCREQSVRQSFVGNELTILKELDRLARRIVDWYDLIIFSVHDQNGLFNRLQVFGDISL